jgi:hypothetical protein
MGPNHKFPKPDGVKPKEGAVLCPADRVLALYNQGTGKKAKKIAKAVRRWFYAEAKRKGWAGLRFLKDVQSAHGAGCVLWLAPQELNVSITITKEVHVLHSSE